MSDGDAKGFSNRTTLGRQIMANGKEDEDPDVAVQSLDGLYPADLAKLKGKALRVDDIKGQDEVSHILRRGFASGLVKRPHMDSLLTASYSIIMMQLDKLLDRAIKGEELSSTEARTLGEYVKAIRALGQEEREQRRADNVSDMSDSALLKKLGGILPPEELKELFRDT